MSRTLRAAPLLALLLALPGCGLTSYDGGLFSSDDDAAKNTSYADTDFAVTFAESGVQSDDQHALLIGGGAALRDVVLCESATAVECAEGATGFQKTTLVEGRDDGRRIYKTTGKIAVRSGLTLSMTVFDDQGRRASRLVRFSKVGESDATAGSVGPLELGAGPRSILSLDGVHEQLRAWADASPRLMQIKTYATVNGLDAVYLRVSKGVGSGEKLPKVLVTAATHGDEKLSTSTLLGFMHKLLSQYGRDAAITQLIDSRDLYFAPTFCPDGYRADSRLVEGKDPNRSFTSPVNPNRTPTKCAAAGQELFLAEGFAATIDLHNFGRMVMYPWSATTQPIQEGDYDRKYRALSKAMADLGRYQFGQIPSMVGTTAEGSSGDFFHWQGNGAKGFKTAAMAIELGLTKRPDPREIQTEVDLTFDMLKKFLEDGPLLFRDGGSSLYEGAAEAVIPPAPVRPHGFVIGEE